MTSQITRISYEGPFRQLSTAPANVSITIRDLCANTCKNISNQDTENIFQAQKDEKRNANIE